jgi:GDPmannose 4,6-dehydratase
MKAALVTGVTGQDGSYLSEFLLEKGYSVYGIARYSSERRRTRIENALTNENFHVIEGDLTDTSRLNSIINSLGDYDEIEIYNLGAHSHVMSSFEQPEYAANVDALGPLRILECIRQCNFNSKIKFYQAGTSEMYGKIVEPIQSETTPFYPRSPYGVSKLFSYWITKNYRESHDLYACTGILFNHESERRGPDFVTRKITLGLAEWMKTRMPVELGNLDAKRDWGHAKDYVEAMWLILQQPNPDDFVIGTGETRSVREFIQKVMEIIGSEIYWEGQGVEEVGKEKTTGEIIIKINPSLYRPAEVDVLLADPTKANTVLNWKPKISFHELVERMVKADLKIGALSFRSREQRNSETGYSNAVPRYLYQDLSKFFGD